jgi:cob(I)alamin adenosyltransferase
MMVKIYTKRGDKGETSTLGQKMNKADILADVLGSIDELNSFIGVVRAECTMYNPPAGRASLKFKITDRELKKIQSNLMTIAAVIAGSPKYKLGFLNYETKRLEKLIDKLTEEMPVLQNFIYPVGYLQMARSIARRAEREVVKMYNLQFKIYNLKDKTAILKYVNRLSDALFVMARRVNLKTGIEEEIWK